VGKTPSEEQLDSIMPWSETLPETCYRTYHQIVENEAEVSDSFSSTVFHSN